MEAHLQVSSKRLEIGWEAMHLGKCLIVGRTRGAMTL